LSLHCFASSIDGSSTPCFNSTLFGDTMDAAWVQDNAGWDGFPSSQFGQLNSPKRNNLETAFSFFKLHFKFSNQTRKSKRHVLGKNRGEQLPGTPGPVGPGRAAHLALRACPVSFSVYLLYFTFSAHEKKFSQ
jgi:hypothetical protein